MSVLIKNMEMPKGCIYANDNDQTEYCPLLNQDDVPFCQYIESEPEAAIGIDERPTYCPLSDVPEPCENAVDRQVAIDAVESAKTARTPDGEIYVAKLNAEMNIQILPYAQPEIIRCKKCLMHGVCRFEQGLGLNGYCSQAERREE